MITFMKMTMPNKENKTTHGGYRPGSGRKTSRKIHRTKVFTIFEDQMPLTDAELRGRLDLLDEMIPAIGHPDFDADPVIQKLSNNPSGSDIAVCNMLSAVVDRAKKMYKK